MIRFVIVLKEITRCCRHRPAAALAARTDATAQPNVCHACREICTCINGLTRLRDKTPHLYFIDLQGGGHQMQEAKKHVLPTHFGSATEPGSVETMSGLRSLPNRTRAEDYESRKARRTRNHRSTITATLTSQSLR